MKTTKQKPQGDRVAEALASFQARRAEEERKAMSNPAPNDTTSESRATPPVESEEAQRLPTYLLRSEAIDLLKEKGKLRESEARRALGKIPVMPTKGMFKKYWYRSVLEYCERVRSGAVDE